MAKQEDVVGSRFGRLVVLERSGRRGSAYLIKAMCDCGTEKIFTLSNVKYGKTTSCGCLHKEIVSEVNFKHGMSYTHPAYTSWASMKQRCFDPNKSVYKDYGGRGITVCSDWMSFEKFWTDMGPSWFPKASLNRVDNDGNYTAANCRWATQSEQMRNTRSSRLIETPFGKMSLAEAAERFDMNYGTLKSQVKRGWTPEKIFGPTPTPATVWRKPVMMEI